MSENKTISSLFLESILENRDRVAIGRSEDFLQMTYEELFDHACRVASFLNENGIESGVGNRVAICMSRNPAYVVSFAACLLFGYAAVLLDSEYPESRREYILNHAAPKFILDEKCYYQAMECSPAQAPKAPNEKTDAVIVYTSGSTGEPKGILHSQISCGLAVSRLKDVIGLTPEDTYGVAARFTFAVHCSDLLLPLCSGSSVVLVPLNVVRDPQLFAMFCKHHEVTATFMAPSLYRTFDRASDMLKTIIVSGEKVSNIEPKGMKVIATYGCSECYVMMAEEIKECSENAFLGKPVGDIGIYILDEQGNESEDGELCVSGVFFTGYLGLPEKTSQVLTDNPFRERDGHEKLFHTHDHVRKLPDGRILYIGRLDWMVKINGNRVEPEEIECVLKSLPEISDSVVKAFPDSQDRIQLCAYYISKSGEEISNQYLIDRLSEKLPAYMIPHFFVRMDIFPKNINGKTDRNALVMPKIDDYRNEYAAPKNDLEARICQAMQNVLGIEQIGVNDDFFTLGGDSLRSSELLTELSEDGLTYSIIYDARTPGQIAEYLANAGKDARTLQMAMEERNRPQPLLPFQTYYLDYQLYAPNRIFATNPLYCRLLPSTASPELVKEAVEKVLHHFAVFGTVFAFDNRMQLVQRYDPSLIPEIEISYVSEEAFE